MSPTGVSYNERFSQVEEQRLIVPGRHLRSPIFSSLFPWLTLLCLFGADIWFIHRFATNSPFQNEWRLVPAGLGLASLEYSSLPGLLLTLLYRVSGPDFRAGIFASLTLLTGLAAAMIMVSRSVRGRPDWSDAVYPLLLLHWGHTGTWLVSSQLDVALLATFAGLILLLIACDGRASFPRQSVMLATFVLLAWCANDVLSPRHVLTDPSHWFRPVTEFLALGIGPSGRQWPMAVGGIVALGFASGAYMLLGRWWKQPGERRRLLGLLLWAGGFIFFALCAIEQGFAKQTGIWRRELAALGPCWIMLVLAIYGRSAFSNFVPRLATMVVMALLWPWPVTIGRGYFNVQIPTNTAEGLEAGEAFKKQFEAMQSDINAGLPEMVIAHRFSRPPNRIGPRLPEGLFATGLALLRERKIGMFASLRPDPDFDRMPAKLATGESPNYRFGFSRAQHVYGAMIKIESATSSQPITLEMTWKPLRNSAQPGVYRTNVRAGNTEDLLVWINDDIVEADIHCERKTLRILQVDFLKRHSSATGAIQ